MEKLHGIIFDLDGTLVDTLPIVVTALQETLLEYSGLAYTPEEISKMFGPSEEGVIQRRVTILDRDKLGLSFEVYCTVKLSLPTKDNLNDFETAITKLAEVVQCATVTGSADYELRVVTRDMHAFDDFLRDKILSLGLVSNIESRIVIRSVKNTTAAPLGLVSPYVSAQG